MVKKSLVSLMIEESCLQGVFTRLLIKSLNIRCFSTSPLSLLPSSYSLGICHHFLKGIFQESNANTFACSVCLQSTFTYFLENEKLKWKEGHEKTLLVQLLVQASYLRIQNTGGVERMTSRIPGKKIAMPL